MGNDCADALVLREVIPPVAVMLSFKTTIKEVINPTQVTNMMDKHAELISLSCEDQMFIAKLKDGIHKD